jgi:NAD(P)-dependent dehydrogenase (short-subunit alcohol dehydrogenase family)
MRFIQTMLICFLSVFSLNGLAAPDKPFQDKVVFVTGGTSGIGLETALSFVKAGAAHVIVCGRHRKKWDSAQKVIRSVLSKKERNNINYVSCDIRVEADVKKIIGDIYDKYGRLDVAFNNAGVQPGDVSSSGHVEEFGFPSKRKADGTIAYELATPKSPNWKKSHPTQATRISAYRESPIATNVFGTFYCIKWEMAYAFSRQPKTLPVAIVNVSSRVGSLPSPGRPLYSAAKAFINSLTRSLSAQAAMRSVETHHAMVRINAIAPGPVDTPLERAAFPGKSFSSAMKGVPMQRIANSKDIAPAVLFLADDKRAGYITGAILPIDGGHVASPILGMKTKS